MMHIHEQSECDLDKKTLTIAARNVRPFVIYTNLIIVGLSYQLTVANLMRMDETLEYTVDPADPGK